MFSLLRVYQFSKRHAMEECRQQVALSQGIKAKLDVQRLLITEKLDQLGFREPPQALRLDMDSVSLSSSTSNVCSPCCRPFLLCLFLSCYQFFEAGQETGVLQKVCNISLEVIGCFQWGRNYRHLVLK